jgi:DNA replication protein DnaC
MTTENPVVCESHGPYTSRLIGHIGVNRPIWTSCTKCEEQRLADERERRRLAESDLAVAAWTERQTRAGIPERFRDRTIDSYVATTDGQKAALKWATEYAQGFDDVMASGRSMLFLGRPGTGKTHLGCAIATYLLRKGASVYYATVQRAMRRIKDTWHKATDEREGDAIRAMSQPDLLILDEIGVQFGSDTEKNLTFDLLNERYERMKPTLLLSNLAKDDVARFLGERVMDRLREDGGRVITFDWDSYRRKA